MRILQELALAAALGVMAVILTNLFLLPMLLSLVRGGRLAAPRFARLDWLCRPLPVTAQPKGAAITLLAALVLLAWGIATSQRLQIDDLTPGVAELRPEPRYNQDSAYIASHFAIGVDVLQVRSRPARGS